MARRVRRNRRRAAMCSRRWDSEAIVRRGRCACRGVMRRRRRIGGGWWRRFGGGGDRNARLRRLRLRALDPRVIVKREAASGVRSLVSHGDRACPKCVVLWRRSSMPTSPTSLRRDSHLRRRRGHGTSWGMAPETLSKCRRDAYTTHPRPSRYDPRVSFVPPLREGYCRFATHVRRSA